jgi:hypothetical protein
MLKYFITIVEVKNGTPLVFHLERDEETIEATVQKELGGWSSHLASTSGANRHEKEFFQAGTTKDGSKAFSILAVLVN